MKRVLITGGAGFIGFHVARQLADECDVFILDTISPRDFDAELEKLTERDNVSYIQGDITDPESLSVGPEKLDAIFHFAAIIGVENVMDRPDEVLRVNAEGVLRITEFADALDPCPRVVFASTSEVYAGTLEHFGMEIPTPETTPIALGELSSRRTSYALSKIFGETALRMHASRYDLPIAIARYHNVYGPRMGFKHVMPQMFVKLENRDRISVRSPDHTRAFCYIDDAVRATIALGEHPDAVGDVFNIGNANREIDIYSLVKLIRETTDDRAELVRGKDDPGSPARRCPDISKLENRLGVTPEIALEEGLRRTYNWYEPRL